MALTGGHRRLRAQVVQVRRLLQQRQRHRLQVLRQLRGQGMQAAVEAHLLLQCRGAAAVGPQVLLVRRQAGIVVMVAVASGQLPLGRQVGMRLQRHSHHTRRHCTLRPPMRVEPEAAKAAGEAPSSQGVVASVVTKVGGGMAVRCVGRRCAGCCRRILQLLLLPALQQGLHLQRQHLVRRSGGRSSHQAVSGGGAGRRRQVVSCCQSASLAGEGGRAGQRRRLLLLLCLLQQGVPRRWQLQALAAGAIGPRPAVSGSKWGGVVSCRQLGCSATLQALAAGAIRSRPVVFQGELGWVGWGGLACSLPPGGGCS